MLHMFIVSGTEFFKPQIKSEALQPIDFVKSSPNIFIRSCGFPMYQFFVFFLVHWLQLSLSHTACFGPAANLITTATCEP